MVKEDINNEEIAVSISCLVFNHEKYLRRCLDSLIMQKTNFKYEVLIHDDASTDNSAAIIQEYEAKYPTIIKPLYQKENQYSKNVKISLTFQIPRARGKYYAFCEGDDFWIDEYKLQKQYDAMEKNPNASMCVHKVECVDEAENVVGKYYPEDSLSITANKILSSEEVLDYLEVKNIYPFQTSSYFIKTSILFECVEKQPRFMTITNTGSINMMIYCATKGGFIYLNKAMSAYRMNSIGSWSMMQRNTENRICHLEEWIRTKQAVNEFLEYRYSKYIEEQIIEYEFEIWRLKHDYKQCLNSKYKNILDSMSQKEKMYIVLNAKIPVIIKGYQNIKSGFKLFLKDKLSKKGERNV